MMIDDRQLHLGCHQSQAQTFSPTVRGIEWISSHYFQVNECFPQAIIPGYGVQSLPPSIGVRSVDAILQPISIRDVYANPPLGQLPILTFRRGDGQQLLQPDYHLSGSLRWICRFTTEASYPIFSRVPGLPRFCLVRARTID